VGCLGSRFSGFFVPRLSRTIDTRSREAPSFLPALFANGELTVLHARVAHSPSRLLLAALRRDVRGMCAPTTTSAA